MWSFGLAPYVITKNGEVARLIKISTGNSKTPVEPIVERMSFEFNDFKPRIIQCSAYSKIEEPMVVGIVHSNHFQQILMSSDAVS